MGRTLMEKYRVKCLNNINTNRVFTTNIWFNLWLLLLFIILLDDDDDVILHYTHLD